jgi:hypothetical protein
MKNKIICTQDVPGERAWVEGLYPEYQNLQTEFSGLWPSATPVDTADQNLLWEIPPDSSLNLDNIDGEKTLSLYQFNNNFVDPRWCLTDSLITTQHFGHSSKSTLAQIITFTRCGTVFLEKLLYQHYDYTELSPHCMVGEVSSNQKIENLVGAHKPDIFIVYRNNWWEWITSRVIAQHLEWFEESSVRPLWIHAEHEDKFQWNNIEPIKITDQIFTEQIDAIFANWNAICHLRTKFRDLNFHIVEFSNLIQAKKDNLDRPIKYKKRNLISNFDDAKLIFEQSYLPNIIKYQTNALQHLTTMKCNIPNFNNPDLTFNL